MLNNSPWQISEKGVTLILEQFLLSEGNNAFPVVNTNKEDIFLVEKQLNKKAVLCPPTLSEILLRSSKMSTISEELRNIRLNDTKKFSEFTSDHYRVIENVISVSKQTIDSQISTSDLTFVNFTEEDQISCLDSSKKIQISAKLLSMDFIHQKYNRCASNFLTLGYCCCRETQILIHIIQTKASLEKNSYMREAYISVLNERVLQVMCNNSIHAVQEHEALKREIIKLRSVIQNLNIIQ